MIAIQDCYPPEFAHCYGCGASNPQGLHLKSYLQGEETVAEFTPDDKYSGGYPGNVYGGLIAALLDCHGTASAAAFTLGARGRSLGDGGPPVRFVTASLQIDYLHPTPMGTPLRLSGRLISLDGRKASIALSLSAEGHDCVRAKMLAIEFRSAKDRGA